MGPRGGVVVAAADVGAAKANSELGLGLGLLAGGYGVNAMGLWALELGPALGGMGCGCRSALLPSLFLLLLHLQPPLLSTRFIFLRHLYITNQNLLPKKKTANSPITRHPRSHWIWTPLLGKPPPRPPTPRHTRWRHQRHTPYGPTCGAPVAVIAAVDPPRPFRTALLLPFVPSVTVIALTSGESRRRAFCCWSWR